MEIADQMGPIAVTLAYVLVYYAFQMNGLRVRARLKAEYAERGEKFDRYFGQDRQMLAVDRTQLNMLEHMPPFLVLLWLNAIFIGPFEATVAGAIYVVARAAYPFLLGDRIGRGVGAKIMISTVTGYTVLIYLAGTLVVGMFA
jgi:hypothetical protein